MTRVTDIDPITLAESVSATLLADLQEKADRLGVELRIDREQVIEANITRLWVSRLAAYAQQGDWSVESAGLAVADVQAAFRGLAMPARVAAVVDASIARVQLSRGEPVQRARLAVLSGMTDRRIRQLADAGELAVVAGKPPMVEAAEALRWLAARGVEGYR